MDDYALHSIEKNTGLRYDQTLSFPSHVSNPLICDTDVVTQAFYDEDHLRFFDSDLQSQNLGLEASCGRRDQQLLPLDISQYWMKNN